MDGITQSPGYQALDIQEHQQNPGTQERGAPLVCCLNIMRSVKNELPLILTKIAGGAVVGAGIAQQSTGLLVIGTCLLAAGLASKLMTRTQIACTAEAVGVEAFWTSCATFAGIFSYELVKTNSV